MQSAFGYPLATASVLPASVTVSANWWCALNV
eukprot:COSAG02_NODE_60400_length_271_cov_0.895349_1_plen_31_part_10